MGFVAMDEIDQRPIGAVWVRLLTGENKGYRYVDDQTPELSMAVVPEHRGRGVGTKLFVYLLTKAHNRYQALSLSVSPENPAVRLYQRFGFAPVGTNGSSLTMVKRIEAQ